jgi:hypothetical protein
MPRPTAAANKLTQHTRPPCLSGFGFRHGLTRPNRSVAFFCGQAALVNSTIGFSLTEADRADRTLSFLKSEKIL